jgi:adenine-specific DNA-methyltransferase
LIYWGPYGDKCPVKKVFRKGVEEEGRTPVNLWLGKDDDDTRSVGFTGNASLELERLTGQKASFLYPKPLKLIKRIHTLSSNKDSVVLDYFAGSGTTGQATLECNAADGGNRKFILVTNNENDIFEDITMLRLNNTTAPGSYEVIHQTELLDLNVLL